MQHQVYLRFLPLCPAGLADLKVDPLDSFCTAHDLDSSKVRLEVVQDTVGQLQERLQPGIMGHVLRQVSQEDGNVKANVLKNTSTD